MRVFLGFLILTIINATGWAYFLLRAANPKSPDAKHLTAEVQSAMKAPARPSTPDEVNALLKDLGPYQLTSDHSALEFGFASGSLRKMLLQGPEVLNYVRRDGAGQITLARHYTGGFSWKIWHITQALRAGYPVFRHFTFKKPHGAWFEVGAKLGSSIVSYSDEVPAGTDVLYCFPGCIRAEGESADSAQQAALTVPFMFGHREQIVYSSAAISQAQ